MLGEAGLDALLEHSDDLDHFLCAFCWRARDNLEHQAVGAPFIIIGASHRSSFFIHARLACALRCLLMACARPSRFLWSPVRTVRGRSALLASTLFGIYALTQ